MYDSELHILSGSSLMILNGATFHARNGNCKIVIDGGISVGENVSFLADEGASIELIINNPDIEVGFFNNTLSNCIITSFAQNLNITNSILNESMVSSYSSDLSVHGSTFNNSTLYLENQTKNQELSVAVTGSGFNTHTVLVGIDILNYGVYLIADNTIQGFHEGLKMNYCGNGIAGNQSIFGNHIFNSTGSGILLYNTTGTVEMNNLHDNFYGIRLMNSCNIALAGNGSAQTQDETQRIKDNTSYEIYCSKIVSPGISALMSLLTKTILEIRLILYCTGLIRKEAGWTKKISDTIAGEIIFQQVLIYFPAFISSMILFGALGFPEL